MAYFVSYPKSGSPTPTYESYIYALGNIGFNTGYIHTANTKIRFKASIDTYVGGYTQVFGARNGSFRANAFTFFGRGNYDGYTLCRSGSEVRGNTIAEDSTGSPWNQTPCIFTAEGTEISWYRDFDPNTVRRIQGSGEIDGGIAPLAIYCCNSATIPGGWSVGDYSIDMRLFWFEIYESDELIHRFVPAYNNNQYCLFDEVEEDYIYDKVSSGARVRGYIPGVQITSTLMMSMSNPTASEDESESSEESNTSELIEPNIEEIEQEGDN